jgi:hypothetical protein
MLEPVAVIGARALAFFDLSMPRFEEIGINTGERGNLTRGSTTSPQ